MALLPPTATRASKLTRLSGLYNAPYPTSGRDVIPSHVLNISLGPYGICT